VRQWKTTGTADAARNGIGSLAEGKVVTVGEPLTILQDLDVTWIPAQEECHFPERRLERSRWCGGRFACAEVAGVP